MKGRSLEQAVSDALEHGSLFGAGYKRTCTIDGVRRTTIRLQADVFSVLYGASPPYYPELESAIREHVAAWQSSHLPRAES